MKFSDFEEIPFRDRFSMLHSFLHAVSDLKMIPDIEVAMMMSVLCRICPEKDACENLNKSKTKVVPVKIEVKN